MERDAESAIGSGLWYVAQGYAWFDARVVEVHGTTAYKAETLFGLYRGVPWGIGDADEKVWDPMVCGGLHRNFSQVKLSKPGILRFATKYGLLGGQLVTLERFAKAAAVDPRAVELPEGNTRTFWEYHITKVRTILGLYDALFAPTPLDGPNRESPEARLAKVVQDWSGVGAPGHEIRIRNRDHSRISRTPYDLRLEFARTMGQRDYNPSSRELANPLRKAALNTIKDFLAVEVNSELSRHARPYVSVGRPGPLLSPRGLIGAIYCHLAIEISGGGKRLFRCPKCLNWDIQDDRRKIYCSGSCKVAHHREQKRNSRKFA